MSEEYKKRGRKRKDHDQGCPNQNCDIKGIVNHEDVIRNGHQKNGEQEYKCNRCGKRFNRRKGTPLDGLRTPIYVIVIAIFMYMCERELSQIFTVFRLCFNLWLVEIQINTMYQ
jgi:transposase-like protein